MKIVHFMEGRCAPDTANGVDKVVFYLSRSQAELGHDVMVMCESRKEPLPVPGVRVENIPMKKNCLKLCDEAREILSEWDPDIIHLHSAYVPTSISVARWARRNGKPYVITPHGNYSTKLSQRRWLVKFLYKRLFELPCAKGAAFVHSMGDGKDIRQFGYQGEMLELPNGFAMDSCLEASGEPAFASELSGKKLILFMGRFDFEQKGLDLLLKGFAEGAGEGTVLVLVGPSWKDGKDRVMELVKSLHLGADRVRVCEPAFGQEKANLLHRCDWFIHTSRWEGFPMAVIEAMAYRLPCIVAPSADPQGVLKRNGLGICCELAVSSIADAIRAAEEFSSEKMADQGQKSRALVETDFSWEQIASAMLDAYQNRSI